ncbi:uncharacterized protein AMSG_00802, partial [Thecamonas trahens ATCC 50062]
HPQYVLAVALVLCLAAAPWSAQAAKGYFSAADATALQSSAAAVLTDSSAAVEDVAAAVKVLTAVGAQLPHGVCAALNKAAAGAQKPVLVAAAVKARAAASCTPLASDAELALLTDAADADNAVDLAAGIDGLMAAGKSVPAGALDALLEFADEDATFRAAADDEYGSIAVAGKVLPVVAAALDAGVEADADALDGLASGLEDLMALAESSADGQLLSFYDSQAPSVDPLVTTGGVLGSLEALTAALKTPVPLSKAQVAALSRYVLARKGVSAPELGASLLDALAFVQSNSVGLPLVISVVRSSVELSAKGAEAAVVVAVTDVRGNAVTGASVVLQSARAAAEPDTVLFANQELEPAAGVTGGFAFPLLQAKPAPGYYMLEFSASAGAKTLPATTVIDAKVVTDAEVKTCSLALVQDDVGGSEKVKYPCAAGKKVPDVIAADSFHELDLALAIRSSVSKRPLTPHQVFLRFVNEATGVDTVFVVPANEAETGHKLTVAFGAAAPEFGSLSGRYTAQIVIGDAFLTQAIVWELATFDLYFGADAPVAAAASSGALPDIVHQFRQPEARPPAAISMAFTAATLAPLLVLGFLLLRAGANIANFPTSQPLMIHAVAFHATIGGIVLLYVTYWLQLTMFQTLGYLAILGTAALFFGKALLSNHTAFRLTGPKLHSE